MTPLPVSRIALAVRVESAGGLPIVATHLASGGKNVDGRRKEIDVLMKWTEKLGPASILVGDFNARPEDDEMKPVFASYRDAGGEATHGDHRIDFILYRGAGLVLQMIEAVESASWFGTAASDHKPLVASFTR